MYFMRKVKCPRNYILKPGRTGFYMELNKALKNLSDDEVKRFKLRRWVKKRDRFGQPIINFNDYIQPEKSAAYIIHHVYDPKHPICVKCNNRCWEGLGKPNTTWINRLHGKNEKGQEICPTPKTS